LSVFSWAQKASVNYDIQTVTGASLGKRVLLGGVVVSSSEVDLSAQVSGDILKINGKEGDVFKRGAVLAVLEQASIQAQKNSALVGVSSARNVLKNAQVQYEKSIVSPYANDMFGGAFSLFTEPMNNFTNRNDSGFNKYANRTSYYTQMQQAKNSLQQAKNSLKQIEERLKDANIVAPFDGVIIAKNVSTGDVIQAGKSLMRFANIQNLQVEVNVPSRLVNGLVLGKKYRIKLDISNIVVEAVLSQIYPIADNIKHSVKVKFSLPSNTPVLSGAYAEVEILSDIPSDLTPVILKSALMWRSSLPSVFIVNPKTHKTELRFLRLGESIDKNKKSVLSGLKIGEKIINNPNVLMVSGMDI
jgi:multidrug efflux pump subunit AcrA (membrane-fusion protein)